MAHSHAPNNLKTKSHAFVLSIALNLLIVVAEIIAAHWGHSTALLADAGHNLSDVLSLVLAGGALWLSQRPANWRRTYGYRRATILASLSNAVLLVAISIFVTWAAAERLMNPVQVREPIVIAAAVVATIVNGFSAWLFLGDHKNDLNVRTAFVHMASDAFLSIGVALSAIGIIVTGWLWLDPAMSLVIVLAILWTTWDLLKDSLNMVLDAVPSHIDSQTVKEYLVALPGVTNVHDLHIWPTSTTEVALTAHLIKPDGQLDDALLAQTTETLRERFGIAHASLQFEKGDESYPCKLSPARGHRRL